MIEASAPGGLPSSHAVQRAPRRGYPACRSRKGVYPSFPDHPITRSPDHPHMARYLLRRLALTIPILLGVSLLVFLMLHSAGGDPAQTILGARADPESIAALRHELGLDRPLPVQYFAFLCRCGAG